MLIMNLHYPILCDVDNGPAPRGATTTNAGRSPTTTGFTGSSGGSSRGNPSSGSGGSGGLSPGAIAGISIGGFVVAVFVAFLGYWTYRHHREEMRKPTKEKTDASNGSSWDSLSDTRMRDRRCNT
jgi:hypothetical protein